MHPTNIDAEFARFQRDGSPDALAAVFDATAPRLLLVAMHLSRDAQTAEDLVQTVFLQAIRDASAFDPARPLLPWLLGILQHRANDLRDRAFARREHGDAALDRTDEAAATTAGGPAHDALDREVRDLVARALDSLPGDYRELLVLRLVHGLQAVEIAHGKGVPPATVRTRLRRGLAMLRSALPRGLATPAVVAWLGVESARAQSGLAVVRRNVLAAARPEPLLLAGTTGLAFGKWLLAAAACAVCGFAALELLDRDVAVPAYVATTDDQVATARGDRAGERDAAGRAARSPIADEAPAPREPAETTELRGRIVGLDDGMPLAGATVSLTARPRRVLDGMPPSWRDPEPVVTARDGTYRLRCTPRPGLSFDLRARAPGHVEATTGFRSMRAGIEASVDDLALERGVPTRLRVLVDERARSGIEVRLGRAVDGRRPTSFRILGETDEAGGIDLGVLAEDTWHYELDGDFDGPDEGRFEVTLERAFVEHVVALRAPPPTRSISGTVVDDAGAPVAGITLRLRAEHARGHRASRTRHDGSFLFALPNEPELELEHRFALPPRRTDLAWLVAPEAVRYGDDEVRLRVRRRAPATLTVEVVDARTDEPIERFGVRCSPDPWKPGGEGPAFQPEPIVSHPSGVAKIDGLRPGSYRCTVHAPPPYADRAHVELHLGEGARETLRVALAPPAELLVDVRDAATGAPMPDVDVTLARVLPEHEASSLTPEQYRSLLELALRGGWSSATNVRPIAHARSDERGQVRLHAAADTPGLTVFATGPRVLPASLRDVKLAEHGSHATIRLAPGGRVHGRLGPAEFVERFGPTAAQLAAAARAERIERPDPERFAEDYPCIELRDADGRTWECHVDSSGAFRFTSLPLGRFEVWCVGTLRTGERRSREQFGPLTSIQLTDAAPLDLSLDLTEQLPTKVHGSLFVDGEPWSGPVTFRRIDTPGVTSATADVGAVEAWLQAGRYLLAAKVAVAGHDPDLVFGDVPLDVQRGRQTDFSAALRRRQVRVTVTTADGSPAAGMRVVLVPQDLPQLASSWRWGQRCDEHGLVVFDPAPPGALRVARAVFIEGAWGTEVEPGATLRLLGPHEHSCEVRLDDG